MAKKHTLPVVKSNGPVAEAPSKTTISDHERRYRAEDGMRTLARAEEIRKDKALMKDIKTQAKALQKAICK